VAAVAIRPRYISYEAFMKRESMITVAAVSVPEKQNQIKRVTGDVAHRSPSRDERKVKFGKVVVTTFEVERDATLLKNKLPVYCGRHRGAQVVDRVFAESVAILYKGLWSWTASGAMVQPSRPVGQYIGKNLPQRCCSFHHLCV